MLGSKWIFLQIKLPALFGPSRVQISAMLFDKLEATKSLHRGFKFQRPASFGSIATPIPHRTLLVRSNVHLFAGSGNSSLTFAPSNRVSDIEPA